MVEIRNKESQHHNKQPNSCIDDVYPGQTDNVGETGLIDDRIHAGERD